MPGFTTHYLFGLNAYKQLENISLKQTIRIHHAAYSLGQQGPDLFFYYLPSYAIHKNNIGAVAHTEKTNEFFRYLLKSRKLFLNQQEQKIAEAYIAGFLGHYALDTRCHPYVYWKTGFKEKNSQYHGRHMGLETEIDTELLEFYRRLPPSAFRQDSTIRLTRRQKSVITKILYYVYSKAYPELGILPITIRTSIRSIQMGTKFLNDPSGRKKKMIGKLEKRFLGHPLLSASIPSDTLTFHTDPLNLLHQEWKNPWDTSMVSNDSFFDLMEDAQKNYLETLKELDCLFYAKAKRAAGGSNREIFHLQPDILSSTKQAEISGQDKLLGRLGNLSYHSGLDVQAGA